MISDVFPDVFMPPMISAARGGGQAEETGVDNPRVAIQHVAFTFSFG